MTDIGEPIQNGPAERFMRTLKEDLVDYADWHCFDEAYAYLKCWPDVEYTVYRIQSAWDYGMPAEVDARVGKAYIRTTVPFTARPILCLVFGV